MTVTQDLSGTNRCVVSLSDDMELNHKFNEVKFFTTQIHHILYKYFLQKKPKSSFGIENSYYKRAPITLEFLFHTCEQIGTNPRREIHLKNGHIQAILRRYLSLL